MNVAPSLPARPASARGEKDLGRVFGRRDTIIKINTIISCPRGDGLARLIRTRENNNTPRHSVTFYFRLVRPLVILFFIFIFILEWNNRRNSERI